MRVLLICVPRTGSTSFLKALSKSLAIPYISIPGTYTYKENSSLIESTIKKKNIIFRMSPDHNVGYDLVKFSSFFDKVILLTRLDDEDHYKSIVNLYYREHILGYGTKGLYVYEDIPKSIIKDIEETVNYNEILLAKQQILDLSLKLQQEVLSYEDIYYSNKALIYLSSNFRMFNKEVYQYNLGLTKRQRITRKTTLI